MSFQSNVAQTEFIDWISAFIWWMTFVYMANPKIAFDLFKLCHHGDLFPISKMPVSWLPYYKYQNHLNIQNLILTDPSPIIGYHCHSLTHPLLFSRLDWCDPGNLKLVDVLTVADVVDDEDRVGNSLLQVLQILMLKSRQDLKLEFGQHFAANVL